MIHRASLVKAQKQGALAKAGLDRRKFKKIELLN